jgi:hypothetical protein
MSRYCSETTVDVLGFGSISQPEYMRQLTFPVSGK